MLASVHAIIRAMRGIRLSDLSDAAGPPDEIVHTAATVATR
jgi:hypothetical protein